MTLDEAILHSEEKAKQLCGKCAEEHAQLAEWLKELKKRRETICGCEQSISEHLNYCPDCGAKMDEVIG